MILKGKSSILWKHITGTNRNWLGKEDAGRQERHDISEAECVPGEVRSMGKGPEVRKNSTCLRN